MNLYAILLTGLLAGGVPCAAVQGGLLPGLVLRQHQPTVLATGVYTLNGGLELAGSPLAASRVAEAVGFGPDPVTVRAAPDDAPPLSTTADGTQQVIVTAVTGAYRPGNIRVTAGTPTRLIVRSRDAGGCVRAFVIADRDIQRILPADGDTVIDLGVLEPGRLDYSCGMGMYTGRLTVVAAGA